jgi:hypothetical protein
MSILFDNNASGTNSVQAEIVDTTITLQTNEGQLFPPVTTASGDFFLLTLEDTSGNIEICNCTDNNSDVLTVARAQENTTAKVFPTGSKVEQRMTAGAIDEFMLRTGATMTGTLDMNGEDITDPVLRNTGTGELLGFALQGSDGGTANEIVVPSAAGTPTLGGDIIATQPYTVATYVPLVRTLTGGEGIATIGDLSTNRTIDLDIPGLATKLGAAVLADDQFLVYDTTAGAHKVIDYRDIGIPIVTATTNTITPTDDDTNAMYVCTHSAGPISFVLNTGIGEVGNVILIQQADATQQVTVSGTATVNAAAVTLITSVQWSVAILVCTAADTWAMYGDIG